jgi:DNA-directed RNA polymerase subunit RPC12/RpoP
MIISSRTPEGMPNRCELCGHDVRIEPSIWSLDAPCPYCGHLLWFAKRPRKKRVRHTLAFSAGLVVGNVLRAFSGSLKRLQRTISG